MRGKVGSGLDEHTIDSCSSNGSRRSISTSRPPKVSSKPPRAVASSCKPEVVVSVHYGGWTDEGRLRHPVFRGVRDRRGPVRVHGRPSRRRPRCPSAPGSRRARGAPRPAPAVRSPRRASRVQVTNPKKIFWPDDGLTKRDLFDYYDAHRASAAALSARSSGRARALPRWHCRQELLPMECSRRHAELGEDDLDSARRGQGSRGHVLSGQRRRHAALHRQPRLHPYSHSRGALARSSRSATSSRSTSTSARRPIAHAVELALSLRGLLTELGSGRLSQDVGAIGAARAGAHGPGGHLRPPPRRWSTCSDACSRGRHPRSARWSEASSSATTASTSTPGKPVARAPSSRPIRCARTKGPRSRRRSTGTRLAPTLSPTRWSMLSVPARFEERGDPMRKMLDERPDVARAVAKLAALVQSDAKRS